MKNKLAYFKGDRFDGMRRKNNAQFIFKKRFHFHSFSNGVRRGEGRRRKKGQAEERKQKQKINNDNNLFLSPPPPLFSNLCNPTVG